ncbi:MAG TPA: hypothetical protein VFP21_06380, partial [Solirubrobacterales bacterium]|nr:hypothetical protein [Solirubrobacterales bacterium]
MAAGRKGAGPISLAVLAAFALALGGCGESPTSLTPTPSRTTSTSEDGGGGGAQTRQSPGRQRSSGRSTAGARDVPGSAAQPIAPLRVSGGGSARFRVEGGDNSIQEYGEEAGEAELRQAAEAAHSLLVARVRSEWARACGLLAAKEQRSLRHEVAQISQGGGRSCAAALALVTKP